MLAGKRLLGALGVHDLKNHRVVRSAGDLPANDVTYANDTVEIFTLVPKHMRLVPSGGATVNIWLAKASYVK
jgi:hypothetical protein